MTSAHRGPLHAIPGGDGRHSVTFFYWADEQEPFALIERHAHQDEPDGASHGGYAAWRLPPAGTPGSSAYVALHQLVAGGPDDVERLTLAPSLACAYVNEAGVRCSSHGWIRSGRWEDA